ncbi:haloacid dehalogenase-like hydrolase [Akkermansiaceae bacterium]|nr:haloacid dehalogenase-like hydrolase [Akkermansiaceae bacterium]MDB4544321.1 haloacid dehalogenase-like hydrolase [Akkermansiaceae bacterium]
MLQKHVLFDLDQTIIPWDTQLVFRSYILQQEPARRFLTLIFIAFLPLNKVLGAGGMKRVFHSYLWGMSRKKLDEHVQGFLTDWLPKLPYPEILEEISEHKQAGHTLVLSSASPELWVTGIGKALGFHLSFGTRFDWGEKIAFFPDLIGENHKGQEKVVRLAQHNITSGLAGYSDSRADLPMLELCAENTLVNPLPGVRKTGLNRNWRILEPARPWKDRKAFAWGCVRQLFGFWKP